MYRSQPLDIYRYVIRNPWKVRVLFALGILTWLFALYGYARLPATNVAYWVIFGPILAFFTVYHGLTYFINLFYRSFDVKEHDVKKVAFWKKHQKQPSVDVFLPICGESSEILHKTFLAVSKMEYANKKVYVLDDQGSEEHQRLAETLGFTYLSREDKGRMKKAGNLQYGYQHSSGEFFAIFDADFAPHPQFLQELVPYMQDPKTAIVQSPQYFETTKEVHDRSWIEYGASNLQEDFYRVIQVARGAFNGSICVGSNAVYRRSAIQEIGGPTQVEHSEDLHMGFDLLLKGYHVTYVPLILAVGLCPSDLHTYFHQQHRWCRGSMDLLFSKKFWFANIPLMTKLCFVSGFMYYTSHAITLLFSAQIFVLLFWYFDRIALADIVPFVPAMVFSFVLIPWFRTTRERLGTWMTRLSHANRFIHATASSLVATSEHWQPSGRRLSGVSNSFYQSFLFEAGYLGVYVMLIALAVSMGRFPLLNWQYIGVMFWVVVFLVSHSAHLIHSYLVIRQAQKEAGGVQDWRARTAVAYAALLLLLPMAGYAYNAKHGTPPQVAAPVLEQVAMQSQEERSVEEVAIPATEQEASPVAPLVEEDIGMGSASSTMPVAERPSSSDTTESVSQTRFVVTAARGGSVHRSAREAVTRYMADQEVALMPWERVFVESMLAQEHPSRMLEIGQSLTFSPEKIASAIDQLPEQADWQRQIWERYAAGVRFE